MSRFLIGIAASLLLVSCNPAAPAVDDGALPRPSCRSQSDCPLANTRCVPGWDSLSRRTNVCAYKCADDDDCPELSTVNFCDQTPGPGYGTCIHTCSH